MYKRLEDNKLFWLFIEFRLSRKVLDIIRAQEEMKDLHDQFHNQVF